MTGYWDGYRQRRERPRPPAKPPPAAPAPVEPDSGRRHVVTWKPIRCPVCGVDACKIYGQSREGGTRYVQCLECGEKFLAQEITPG